MDLIQYVLANYLKFNVYYHKNMSIEFGIDTSSYFSRSNKKDQNRYEINDSSCLQTYICTQKGKIKSNVV